jgi:hypothetical protein
MAAISGEAVLGPQGSAALASANSGDAVDGLRAGGSTESVAAYAELGPGLPRLVAPPTRSDISLPEDDAREIDAWSSTEVGLWLTGGSPVTFQHVPGQAFSGELATPSELNGPSAVEDGQGLIFVNRAWGTGISGGGKLGCASETVGAGHCDTGAAASSGAESWSAQPVHKTSAGISSRKRRAWPARALRSIMCAEGSSVT